jgi:hypothetical protein
MELDKVLSKVRGLIEKAEHPSTPEAEAKLCRDKADAMMTQYAIDQAQLRDSAPVAEQQKPGQISVDLCPCGSPYEQPVTSLVVSVAEHCRCQVIFSRAGWSRSKVEEWKRFYPGGLNVQAKVFGFESDLRYFEMLFTILFLHMSSGYDPKIDRSLSDEDNAYALHNAGLNWRAIARLYGETDHPMGWDGVIRPDGGHLGRAGAYWKSCYMRAIRSRGESEVKLKKFSDSNDSKVIGYRYNFAMSYISTVRMRLEEVRSSRATGGELVLLSSTAKIREFIDELFPDLKDITWESNTPSFNPTAWSAGNKHGLAADLNASSRVANKSMPELG